jgi:drug/metabolite transporter (DMT)-like permease
MVSLLHPSTHSRTALLAINLSVLLWAVTPLFAKLIPLPAEQLIWLRSVVSVFALLVLFFCLGKPIELKRQSIGIMIGLGVLMTAHWVTFFHSVQLSTVGMALMALYSYPLITIFIEPLFSKQRIQRIDIVLGIVLSIGLLVMLPELSWSNRHVQGIGWGLIAAVTFSLRNLMSRYHARDIDSLNQIFFQSLVAALILPLGIWSSLEIETLTPEHWLNIVVMAVLFVLVPHTLFIFSLKHIPTKTVSMIATIQPVYGLVFAYFLLGEVATPTTLIGGGIIVAVALFETLRIPSKKGKIDE